MSMRHVPGPVICGRMLPAGVRLIDVTDRVASDVAEEILAPGGH